MKAAVRRVSIDETWVAMRDGVRLATDVCLADDGRAHPVLLVRSPYGRASLRVNHDPTALARAGWAVVMQDTRGRYDSEGTFDPFHQEIDDGFDTVAWCAAQPWSDGRVAMTGMSYNGATQWLAAASQAPALRAISPGVSSPCYRETWSFENGAFEHGFVTNWSIGLVTSQAGASRRDVRRGFRALDDWRRFAALPVRDNGVAELFPPYAHWSNYVDDDYWQPIDVSQRMSKLDVAGYHVAGWYDIFCEGTITGYARLCQDAASDYARASQRLVIGPWWHGGVFMPSTVHADFGSVASGLVQGYPQEMFGFLRSALDGAEVPSGVSAFVMGRNRWLELSSWPPSSTPMSFYLAADSGANGVGGDGRLVLTPTEHKGRDRYRHDMVNPVPNRGGRSGSGGVLLIGPMDQRIVEERDDVLVYTSDPLARDLWAVGMVTARIHFASTASGADVTVKVVDVHPDGTALNVVDSVRRLDPAPPRPRAVELDVGSTAMVFRRGHRIRVEIASSNFPRFDVQPTGDQTVHWGGRTPSCITLPVYAPG